MATLFLICGMAGAGKTTWARELEKSHPALRLSPDEWIASIIEDVANKAELDRLRDTIEALQWNTAQKVLSLGVSVILENGFWSKRERMALQTQAKLLGVRIELHYLAAPLEELWQRIEKRNANSPQGCFQVTRTELELWSSWFEPPTGEEISTYDDFVWKPQR